MRVLLVEDEKKLNASIKKGLEQKGYAVDGVFDGVTGELFAKNTPYDLIILDILMPKQDGIVTCGKIREAGISVPILFLTARDAIEQKIEGLDAGADDYLVKPFEFSELLARIRALLRRPAQTLPVVLKKGDIILDTKTQAVHVGNKEVQLTRIEFNLLEYFMRNINTVLTREEIMDHVWNTSSDSYSNTVDAHIKNLRKKIKGGTHEKIQTIRGIGYKLTE